MGTRRNKLSDKNWSIAQRQPRRPYPASVSTDASSVAPTSTQPMLIDFGSHQDSWCLPM